MSATLLTICVIAAAAALALAFRPYVPAAVVAFVSLMLGRWSGYAAVSVRETTFWAVATILVAGISALLPKALVQTSRGQGYIAGGALAGAAAGMLLSSGAMIAASAAGAAFGAIAYARTPAGRPLDFPSQNFLQYLCAKGLPAVVAVSVIGLLAIRLINH